MKHKVGDTVRIRSKEWIDAQERDEHWDISLSSCGKQCLFFIAEMEEYAGKEARILRTNSNATDDWYKLDIDNKFYNWQDWMFDPDYGADDPLSVGDAILAMIDGEILMDTEGREYSWSKDIGWFVTHSDCSNSPGGIDIVPRITRSLYRHLSNRKRPMTRFEVLNWVSSEVSHGWLVKMDESVSWHPPQFYGYERDIYRYQRARLLPDCSGVDEDTIQGFEVVA
jgi:hypothetical protein